MSALCANCGFEESEHSYNGACYGVCADFIAAPKPCAWHDLARLVGACDGAQRVGLRFNLQAEALAWCQKHAPGASAADFIALCEAAEEEVIRNFHAEHPGARG